MSCITFRNLFVLINGDDSKFFRASRGIRQGCPLSPLLFLLIVEALSILVKKIVNESKLKGVRVIATVMLTHLLFVDDVLLFGLVIEEE